MSLQFVLILSGGYCLTVCQVTLSLLLHSTVQGSLQWLETTRGPFWLWEWQFTFVGSLLVAAKV